MAEKTRAVPVSRGTPEENGQTRGQAWASGVNAAEGDAAAAASRIAGRYAVAAASGSHGSGTNASGAEGAGLFPAPSAPPLAAMPPTGKSSAGDAAPSAPPMPNEQEGKEDPAGLGILAGREEKDGRGRRASDDEWEEVSPDAAAAAAGGHAAGGAAGGPAAGAGGHVAGGAVAQEEELECPVCFEPIAEQDAAMRCTGHGGRPHYFHAACLGAWVQQCRGNWANATCPCCRGPVEVNARRLSEFLGSAEAEIAMDAPQRGEVRSLLDRINGSLKSVRDGWSRLEIKKEHVVEGVGIVAGAGWGFMNGAALSAPSTGSWHMDQFLWDSAPRSARIAACVGYGAGVVYGLYRRHQQAKDDDDDDDQKKGDKSDDEGGGR